MGRYFVFARRSCRRAIFRRDFGEKPLRNWHQKATGNRGDTTMDLNAKTAKLHWLVTLVALALATVAAQSPFF
jgi:hypothetical protein